VISVQYQHNFEEFINFLEVLEVYGMGYNHDINVKNPKTRDYKSHNHDALAQLAEIVRLYKIVIS
jgi:phenolic acid decarboxylase